MKKQYKRIIFICIFILIIIFIVLIGIFLKNNISNKSKEFTAKTVNLEFKNRISSLRDYQYKDFLTVGWLQVQGTNIDYPILNSDASSISPTEINYGWRSPYYQTGENREVIMGHNIVNVSSNPIREMNILNNFEGLMAFTYDDFAKNNLYISYTKGEIVELYKIYAVGFYDYYSDNAESFSKKEDIKSYIKKVRDNSIYDYTVDVTEEDNLITIKTCTRYFGLNEKQELYIDARKVREDENIETYQVTKNDNYKILSKGISNENG